MVQGGVQPQSTTSNFMLSFKGPDRVKVVNAEKSELKLLSGIIRRHCQILKEGWDRHLTYSYRLKVAGRHSMIQLVADTLLSLYQAGWEPMTPMDMGLRREKASGPQTTICFKRREGSVPTKTEDFGSTYSIFSKMGSSMDGENSCLCLEIFQANYLGFHEATNTVLHELVTTIQREWLPGIRGVSMGVASVITDYTTNMPPVLATHPQLRDERYIQLEGSPWQAGQEDPMATESLQLAIIACLTREGYKLSMDINMDTTSRVYFFIRDTEEQCGEVRVPHMVGNFHRPKSCLDVRPNPARRKLGMSLSHPAVRSPGEAREAARRPAMRYKPLAAAPAWWQQTSTDVSSDHEED